MPEMGSTLPTERNLLVLFSLTPGCPVHSFTVFDTHGWIPANTCPACTAQHSGLRDGIGAHREFTGPGRVGVF